MTPYIPTTLTDLPLPLPEDRALAAARQLLEVLKYLSTPTEEYEFVLHRDIKPSNILVEEGTGRVVLCDFGASVKVKKGEMHPSIAGDLQIRARPLQFHHTRCMKNATDQNR
jgi:serine/threonine protein kinase